MHGTTIKKTMALTKQTEFCVLTYHSKHFI